MLDPWLGAAMSVAEATRNVSITGARPLGVTNCLNYGDPTRPEAFWQLAEGVRGLADACTALGLPVTGGNVSLYNEAPGSAIAPTPEIGIVGLLADVADARRAGVHRRRQRGPARRATPGRGSPAPSTSASPAARPRTDRRRWTSSASGAVQAFIREAIDRGLVETCQDVSGGGFAVAVAEMCIWGERGALLRLPVGDSPAVALFGESPSRLVCEVAPAPRAGVRAARPRSAVSRVYALGTTGGTRLRVGPRRRGRHGSRGGAREPDRGRARRRRWRTCATRGSTGLPRALGWEGAGADDHVADAALPGAEVAG